MMHRAVYVIRAALVFGALGAGFAAVTAHLYRLQIVRHDELLEKARAKYTTSRTESGRRGAILDVNGNLLAGNLACRDVLAEPGRFRENQDEVIAILHEELGVSPDMLRTRFSLDRVEVVVKRGVPIAAAQHLAAYDLPGIRFVDTYRRYYPKASLFANMLGFLDNNGRGVSGIEALMDDTLQPTLGRAVFERDRKGRQLHNDFRRETQPRDGANVYLTIDEPIQSIVEDELAVLVDHHAPKAAYIVMADPRDGAILAVGQYPNFDPNRRLPEAMRHGHWLNRVLTHGFEPGSIMKCISIAGALDFNVVTLGDLVDCEDGYWVHHRRPLRDSGHRHGELRVWEVIQKSSNIGTAKIALDMGERRMFQTLRRFGFGQPTGLGFQNEATGIFRPLRNWDGLSLSRFAIGQGILVTPLQMVQAYCGLANKGVMMQLRIIDRIEHPEPGVVDMIQARPKARVLRPEAAEQMVAAMMTVTRAGGTARGAAVPGYDVAGKTGTSQKFVNGTYESGKHTASFIGFVPADDPAFVLLIAVDEPTRNGYYGSAVAAPAFSRIAEKTLRYLQVAPTRRETPLHAQTATFTALP